MNAAFSKFHVRVTDTFGDYRRVTARDFEHLVCHVNADDPAARSNDLRSDETDFPSAAAQIDNDLAFVQVIRRIAATVIALDYFLRNHFK